MYAVLLPIVRTDEGYSLLMEVRSKYVPQPGEVCFPGGRIERGESPCDAALRETYEELGIHPDDIDIIYEAEPELTASGRKVYPIVAKIRDDVLSSLTVSYAEVESVFFLPLEWIFENEAEHYTVSSDIDLDTLPVPLRQYLIHYRPFTSSMKTYYREYEAHGIWGLTARIIEHLTR